MTFEYHVFLRHNSKDKPAVEAIASLLQQKYQLKEILTAYRMMPVKSRPLSPGRG